MTTRDAVIATYELEGKLPLEDCARVVAMEQSTGTWTPVAQRAGSVQDRLAAWVESTDPPAGTARIAFPLEIFDGTNLAGFLSIVAGNLFGLASLRRARLVDLEVSAAFAGRFAGPGVGITGIRKLVGTDKDGRPHGGTIVKPKVGLTPKQTAEVAFEAASGGLDFIKDDETLTDQAFCPLAERTPLVMEALDSARASTGQGCLYAVNITAGGGEILSRLDAVTDAGANCVMVDVLTAGFDALAQVRRSTKLPIHVHRTMHGALTRSPDFGIAMLPIARLVRLCGGDQLHIGSASGKMEHTAGLNPLLAALRGDWHGLKPVFPVSSGGLHPASVPAEMKAFGGDVVLQAGGGIHGHPQGTKSGARAFMQAIDAVHLGRPLDRNPPPELAVALKLWGKETYGYGT
ncbi:MAG: RuBisCO large subunit C-terminal-like domain-containing protein [Candidatus Thermoplasmatota archaeon]|jgi:ribulose-bisphosphate carboxylase large chain